MSGLYPKVFSGNRKGQKNIFKTARPASIWDNDQAFDPFRRRAVCDWNRKELVPFTSASNCKFCPVMTGIIGCRKEASWVSTPSLIGLWEASMGIAKCSPSTQLRGLQEPPPVGSWSLRPPAWAAGQGWLCRALRNVSVQTMPICLYSVASCREHIFSVQFNKLLEISKLLVS